MKEKTGKSVAIRKRKDWAAWRVCVCDIDSTNTPVSAGYTLLIICICIVAISIRGSIEFNWILTVYRASMFYFAIHQWMISLRHENQLNGQRSPTVSVDAVIYASGECADVSSWSSCRCSTQCQCPFNQFTHTNYAVRSISISHSRIRFAIRLQL